MNQELSESFKPDLADKDLREMNISEMTADEIRVIYILQSNLSKNRNNKST